MSRSRLRPRLSTAGTVSVAALLVAACSGASTPSAAPIAASVAPAASADTQPASGSPAASTAPSGGAMASLSVSKVTIMVGGLNKIIYLPAMLTQQLGYFKDEGLDVSLVDEGAGQDATEAVVAGQVQGAVGFYDHTVDLQGAGKSLVDVVQFDAPLGEVEMVATAQADKIKSPADFKGQNLGVTGHGSSTDLLSHYLAVHAGLQASDITTVPVGAGDTFIAAMQHGQIVAGMTTEPTVSRLLKTGLAKILIDMRTVDGSTAGLGGNYPGASLYMMTDWVTAHPDTTQRLVDAFVKTLKWIHGHTAADIVAQMPADYSAGDAQLYLNAMQASLPMFTADGHMPQGAPELVLKVLEAFDTNVEGKTIDLSKTFTNQFVDQANAGG